MSSPTSIPSNGADRRSTAAPYAFPYTGHAPVDGALPSARGTVGPYVPAPWRGTPEVASVQPVTPRSVTPRSVTPRSVTPLAVEAMLLTVMPPSYPTPVYFTPLGSQAQDELVAPDDLPRAIEETEGRAKASSEAPLALLEPAAPSLPWIDAFLSTTPAIPMRAVDEPVETFTPASPAAIVEEVGAHGQWPVSAATPEAQIPSDAWALEEAAEQMRSLADELREHDGISGGSGEVARLFDATSSSEQLAAWGDDDLIDIMPLHTERAAISKRMPTPGASRPIEPWADRARRPGDENAESAARALEVLARRVREGEISLAGYEPRLGDAAALAAALAALLGARR